MCHFVFTFLHISFMYFQSEKVLYLATEYVEPLETHLRKLPKEGHQRELYIAWGIFQITVSSCFILWCRLRPEGMLTFLQFPLYMNVTKLTVCSELSAFWTMMATCDITVCACHLCLSMQLENGSWEEWNTWQGPVKVQAFQSRSCLHWRSMTLQRSLTPASRDSSQSGRDWSHKSESCILCYWLIDWLIDWLKFRFEPLQPQCT